MSTLREDFEAFATSQGLEVGPKKADGRHWSSHTHLAWIFYQAATERAAKVVEQVGPQDGSLALVTTGFAAAIRGGGEAGS